MCVSEYAGCACSDVCVEEVTCVNSGRVEAGQCVGRRRGEGRRMEAGVEVDEWRF